MIPKGTVDEKRIPNFRLVSSPDLDDDEELLRIFPEFNPSAAATITSCSMIPINICRDFVVSFISPNAKPSKIEWTLFKKDKISW